MDYASLVALIPGYVVRPGDTNITANIDTFIQLAEAKLNRRLRVREMIVRTTATIEDEFSAVPDNFGGVLSFSLDEEPLVYLTPQAMEHVRAANSEAGKPKYYSIVGGEFWYLPSPNDSYVADLSFYQKIPALTAEDDTNWLIGSHPDIYLNAVALEAALYLVDDELVSKYGGLLDTILNDLDRQSLNDSTGDTLTSVSVCV